MNVNSQDDIGFHWDRDYGFEGESGINVHPHLSTVTYFTDCGGPTVTKKYPKAALREFTSPSLATSIILSKWKQQRAVKAEETPVIVGATTEALVVEEEE
eukprot:gene41085-50840_t